jgi:hypothetical protein
MAEFLKDCMHELKDLDIKNIDFAYIKELEIKVMVDLATVKKGEKPIYEIRDIIIAEETHVMSFLYRIDKVIREYVKEMNEIQEWQTYEHIPEKDIVEQSIAFGTIRTAYLEDTGVQTKGFNITLEEAQKTHVLAFYVPIFKEYAEFLKRTETEIDTIINDPEYWNMRTIAEMDKIREAPPEADMERPGFVLSIAGYYPKFINHYPELEKAKYIRETDTGLQWLKSKQSLAEYFSAIKPEDKSNNWTILENVFDVKKLRHAASQNGNPFKNKKSKDFEALQRIITI